MPSVLTLPLDLGADPFAELSPVEAVVTGFLRAEGLRRDGLPQEAEESSVSAFRQHRALSLAERRAANQLYHERQRAGDTPDLTPDSGWPKRLLDVKDALRQAGWPPALLSLREHPAPAFAGWLLLRIRRSCGCVLEMESQPACVLSNVRHFGGCSCYECPEKRRVAA